MERMQNGELQYGNNKRKRKYLILLAALLLLSIAVTSVLVGYNLGQYTELNNGRIIDTIFLSPTDPSETVPFSISGIVRYSDGEPCAGKTIELMHESRNTVTDVKGRFFYYNIGQDNHRIKILDENGKDIASLELTVSEKLSGAELEQQSGGGYNLYLPCNVLLVELELVLDKVTGILDIGAEGLCIVQTGGRVSTKDGNAEAEAARFILTPQGNTVLTDGSVNLPGNGVMLNNGTYIAPDMTVTFPEGIDALPNGIDINSDSMLTLSDGTELSLSGDGTRLLDGTSTTDSIVTLPDGVVIDSENHIITTSDGTVVDTNVPGFLPDGTSVGSDGTVVTPSGMVIYMPNGNGYIVSDSATRPIGTDSNGVKIIVKDDTSGVFWTQKTEINLFKDSGKLYPGVYGSYDFNIKNAQSFNIGFTMTIRETDHTAGSIPFEYRLKIGDIYIAESENGWMTASQLKGVSVILPTGGNTVYTLEWRWPFNSGDDGRDTRLGSDENGEHTIKITIKAEQVS